MAFEDPTQEEIVSQFWADDPKMQHLIQNNWLLRFKLQNELFDPAEMRSETLTRAGHPLARESLVGGITRKKEEMTFWERFQDIAPFGADWDNVQAEGTADTLQRIQAGEAVSADEARSASDFMKRQWLGKTFGGGLGDTLRKSVKMGGEFALMRAPVTRALPFTAASKAATAGKTSLLGKLIPDARIIGTAKKLNAAKQGGFIKEVLGKGAVFSVARQALQEGAAFTPYGGPSDLQATITHATMPDWTITPDDEGNLRVLFNDAWKPVTGGLVYDAFMQVAAEDMSEFWGFRYADDVARIGGKALAVPARWARLQGSYGRLVDKVAKRAPSLSAATKEIMEAGGIQNLFVENLEEYVGFEINAISMAGRDIAVNAPAASRALLDAERQLAAARASGNNADIARATRAVSSAERGVEKATVKLDDFLPGTDEAAMILASTGIMIGLPMLPVGGKALLTKRTEPADLATARELIARIATEEKERAEAAGEEGPVELTQEQVEQAYEGWRAETGKEIERVDVDSIEDEAVHDLIADAADKGVTVLPGSAAADVGSASVGQGIVMVNVNQSAAAIEFDLYHELLHDFRMRDTKAARELDAALEKLQPGSRKAALERYNERRVAADLDPLSTDLRKKLSYDEATANRVGELGGLIHLAAGDKRAAQLMEDIVTNRRFVGTAVFDWVKDKVNALAGTDFKPSERKKLDKLLAVLGTYAEQNNLSPTLVSQLQGELGAQEGVDSVKAALAFNDLIQALSGSPALDPGIIDEVEVAEPEEEELETEEEVVGEEPPAPKAKKVTKKKTPKPKKKFTQEEVDAFVEKEFTKSVASAGARAERKGGDRDEGELAYVRSKVDATPGGPGFIDVNKREAANQWLEERGLERVEAEEVEAEVEEVEEVEEAEAVEEVEEPTPPKKKVTKKKAKKAVPKGKVKEEKVKAFTKERLAKEREKIKGKIKKSGEDFDVAWKRRLEELQTRFEEGDVSNLEAINRELATLEDVEVPEVVEEAEAEAPEAEEAAEKPTTAKAALVRRSTKGMTEEQIGAVRALQAAETSRARAVQSLENKSAFGKEGSIKEAEAKLKEADTALDAAEAEAQGLIEDVEAQRPEAVKREAAVRGTGAKAGPKTVEQAERTRERAAQQAGQFEEEEAKLADRGVKLDAARLEIDTALQSAPAGKERSNLKRRKKRNVEAIEQNEADRLKLERKGKKARRRGLKAQEVATVLTAGERAFEIPYSPKTGKPVKAKATYGELPDILREARNALPVAEEQLRVAEEEGITPDMAEIQAKIDESLERNAEHNKALKKAKGKEKQGLERAKVTETGHRNSLRKQLADLKADEKAMTKALSTLRRRVTSLQDMIERVEGYIEEFAGEAEEAGVEALALNVAQRARWYDLTQIKKAYKRLFKFMKTQRNVLRNDVRKKEAQLRGQSAQDFKKFVMKPGKGTEIIGVLEEDDADKGPMVEALEGAELLPAEDKHYVISTREGGLKFILHDDVETVEDYGYKRDAIPSMDTRIEKASAANKPGLERAKEIFEQELEEAEARLRRYDGLPSGALLLEDIQTHQELKDYIKKNLRGEEKRHLGLASDAPISWPYFLIHALQMPIEEQHKTLTWLEGARKTKWAERIPDLHKEEGSSLYSGLKEAIARAEEGEHGMLPAIRKDKDGKDVSEEAELDRAMGSTMTPLGAPEPGSAIADNSDYQRGRLEDQVARAEEALTEGLAAWEADEDHTSVEMLSHAAQLINNLRYSSRITQEQALIDRLDAALGTLEESFGERIPEGRAEEPTARPDVVSIEEVSEEEIEGGAMLSVPGVEVVAPDAPISVTAAIENPTHKGGTYNLTIPGAESQQIVAVTLRPTGLKSGIPQFRLVYRDTGTGKPAVAYSEGGARAMIDGIARTIDEFARNYFGDGPTQGGVDVTVVAPSYVEMLDKNGNPHGIADPDATFSQLGALQRLLNEHVGVVESKVLEEASPQALAAEYRKNGKLKAPKNSEFRVRLFASMEQMYDTLGEAEFDKVERRREAANRLHNIAVKLSVPAWHGGHPNIDRFSTDKIGTGEGATAYGWGLYFTAKRKIAEHYKKQLERMQRRRKPDTNPWIARYGDRSREMLADSTLDGVTIRELFSTPEGLATLNAAGYGGSDARTLDHHLRMSLTGTRVWKIAAQAISHFSTSKAQAKDHAKSVIGTSPSAKYEDYQAVYALIDRMEGAEWGTAEAAPVASVYAVELLPEEEDYLLWDGFLPEQSEKVQAALQSERIAPTVARLSAERDPKYIGGRELYLGLAEDIRGESGSMSSAYKEASLALLEAGIRGNKYLDGASRSKGEGNYNYVIFDDADIQPLEAMQGARLSVPHLETAMEPTGALDQTQPRGRGRRKFRRMLVDDVVGAVDFERMVLEDERGVQTDAGKFISKWRRYRSKSEDRIMQSMYKYVYPLITGMARANITMEEFNDYLRTRFQPERNAMIEKRNPTVADAVDKAGQISTAAARREFNEIVSGRRAEFQRLGRQWDKFMRANLDTALEAELITQEGYDAMSQYKHYAPMKFEELTATYGESRDLNIRGNEFHRANGTTGKSNSQFEFGVLAMEAGLIRAAKNEVDHSFIQFARDNEWLQIIDERRPRMGKEVWNDELGMHQIEYVTDPSWVGEAGTLSMKEKGKVVHYRIRPEYEDLIRSVAAMSDVVHGDLFNKLSSAARMMSQLHTRYNPEFVARNFSRDVLHASYMIAGEKGVRALAQTMNPINYGRAVKAIAKYARAHSFGAVTEEGEVQWTQKNKYDGYAREYHQEGGFISFANLREFIRVAEDLKRLLRRGRGEENLKDTALLFAESIGAVNDVVENGSRFAHFVALREGGTSAADAALEAKELTVNFEKRGEYSRGLNAHWLFSSAGLLGVDRVMSMMLQAPGVAINLFGSTLVAGFVLDAFNSWMGGEDDEGRDEWDKVSRQEKEKNLVFMLGGYDENGEPRRIKIPSPWVIRWFGNMGQRTGAWIRDDNGLSDVNGWGVAGSALSSAVEELNPIGSLSPWWYAPTAEINANENFWGSPIYREKAYSPYDLPASQQYFDSVNPSIRMITDALNEFGKDAKDKGDPRKSGGWWFDWNPEKVEHYIEAFTGGAGKTFFRTLDTADKSLRGEEIEVSGVPFLRSFYAEGFYKGKDKSLVYDIKSEARRALDSMRNGDRPVSDPELATAGWPYTTWKAANNLTRELTSLKDHRETLKTEQELEALDVYEKNLIFNYLKYYFKDLRPLLKKRGIALPDEIKQ